MDGKKTLPLSWNEQIKQSLWKLWNSFPEAPVVLIGVGNPLMGDDAAGLLVIQKLKTSLPAAKLIIPVDGGPAPENCSGLIRRLKPGLVFFIDAGDMGEIPGTVGVFAANKADGVTAFGHSLPLSVLGQYLEAEVGCHSFLQIIQPEYIDFDLPVSQTILATVDEICDAWMEAAAFAPKRPE
ncbi:MAG: hydrogenase maturation protease [Leptolinea sp.]|nr:hydrogenase maturation protease [Leptolinea sp.]